MSVEVSSADGPTVNRTIIPEASRSTLKDALRRIGKWTIAIIK
jgi:hypothetical protein